MQKVLVVEDSPMVIKVLRHVLSGSELFQCDYAASLEAARALVEAAATPYFAALVDLNLPDAPDGEVVDYSLGLGIPTVVLTASFDAEKRQKLLAKGIVDYVTKEGKFSYDYAFGVLERLVKNQAIKVLVVDDSDTARNFVASLLRLHLYQVLEAVDGAQAVKLVLANPDLKLLITDYNMPRMSGCELVKNIRLKYEKSDLVIIGLSSENESSLSARFIKSGANDFLRKPFNHEEFYCRVTHNVEFIELIETIRDAALRDEMTGAYNRRYFYQRGAEILVDGRANGREVSVAVIDLDGFHQLNGQYGYNLADKVMQTVVRELNTLLQRFVFARSGGKEFFLMMPGLDNAKAVAFVEKVRQIISVQPVEVDGHCIDVTFSAGVSSRAGDTVDEMMAAAAACLQRAKEAGGALVLGDD